MPKNYSKVNQPRGEIMKQLVHKKKNALVKNDGLKLKQRMMIKLLVAGMKLEDIAERLDVSTARCKRWLLKPEVMKAVEEKTQEFANEFSKKRSHRLDFISSELYEALLEKVAKGHIKRMGSKNLLKFQLEFEKESRAQHPPSTQKVDVSVKLDLEELVNKYKNSNSMNYDSKKDRVVDITPPRQLEESKDEEGDKNGPH